ncbi:hypothetical protein [Nocardia macrotermitis]|uniref:Uncharacterized protein n=1 Tax=Nocardia macrotermitis TaxID=2585198 RepID=A0A7K0D814_9NOCA|nr:hypothetical protein [Nocardia macrotermitis]MQY21923.1 hypothetical protein [Nocardia macrotermitis]
MQEPNSSGPQRVGLDLIAPEVYAPVLRRFTALACGAAVVAAVVLGLLVNWVVAVLAGVLLLAPAAIYAVSVRWRRIWLAGTVIEARTLTGLRRVDIAQATGVEILVYPGRLSRIVLRVTAGRGRQVIPLAMYTDAGGGRELHILGLRTLADALASSHLAAALGVSSMLVGQLRAEARDAGLGERPLYRAVHLVRVKDVVQPVALSDAEIAALG